MSIVMLGSAKGTLVCAPEATGASFMRSHARAGSETDAVTKSKDVLAATSVVYSNVVGTNASSPGGDKDSELSDASFQRHSPFWHTSLAAQAVLQPPASGVDNGALSVPASDVVTGGTTVSSPEALSS
jgi:hypothetical protein